jgi:hypothetical protein
MNDAIRSRLNEYYIHRNIHPANFNCPRQSICRQSAFQGKMTETKMSMVGSHYGEEFPRICVVSLDPPAEPDDVFLRPEQRTTEYIARIHESENFTVKRPGSHWAMTQIIVKELLSLWGYKARPGSATVLESYSKRFIENISAYFAHVNVAKCSMNNPGRRQSSEAVHQLCSSMYLLEELAVLEPQILISQGADTNRILGDLLIHKAVSESDLPMSEWVKLGKAQALWLPMHHPTQQINKIRNEWPTYLGYVSKRAR